MRFFPHEIDKNILVLSADGEINSANSDQILEEIGQHIEGGAHRIIVDCTHVDYLSSYGLGVLLRVHSRMKKQGGDVKLCCLKGVVVDLLQVTGLNRIFEVYPDMEKAVAAFGK